jgi:hypothetical protein
VGAASQKQQHDELQHPFGIVARVEMQLPVAASQSTNAFSQAQPSQKQHEEDQDSAAAKPLHSQPEEAALQKILCLWLGERKRN